MAALAAACAIAAPAQSDTTPPVQLLPNLRQMVPGNVQLAQVNGQWRIGFTSDVVNDGPGPLQITGTGPGNAPMTQVDQTVEMSAGAPTTIQGVGQMHYVVGGGHEHWHFMDFERYELRSAADPSTPLVLDQKTGYCLADAYTADQCGRNQPELTTISEGISVHGHDAYLGYLEGQYLVIDPSTTPSGDYILDNHANPNGALAEVDPSNDVASVRLSLSWGGDGTPSIFVTNQCLGTYNCQAPPGSTPGPDPNPQPQPPTTPADPTATAVLPAPEPVQVPVVAPSQFAPASARASMSRSMAGRLVREAIKKSTKTEPKQLRTTCARKDVDTFACKSSWRGQGGQRWSARVRVWYRIKDATLSWLYDFAGKPRGGEKLLVKRAVKGTASRAVTFGATGALYCAFHSEPAP